MKTMNTDELILAEQLVKFVTYEELHQPLLQNYHNVQELIQTVKELKKQLYNKQRDIDVLIFELANYKPDETKFSTPDPLTIDEEFI